MLFSVSVMITSIAWSAPAGELVADVRDDLVEGVQRHVLDARPPAGDHDDAFPGSKTAGSVNVVSPACDIIL